MSSEKPTVQTAPSKPRLTYIDNLRILLTILVILHHLAIGYGGPGFFKYVDPGQISDVSSILLTLMLAINQAFFMGFFFMISSYFSPGSYDRKGAWPFLKDRLLRLAIPLLFYILVISPLLDFGLARHQGFSGSFGQFLPGYLADYWILGVGPLWFVEILLIFTVAYVVWRLVTKPAPTLAPDASGADVGKAPGNGAIAVFALVLGVLTFVVRIWRPVGKHLNFFGIEFAFFVQYIALFIVGTVAYRRKWFSGLTVAQGKLWRWMIPILVVLFFVIALLGGALEGNADALMGGFYWQALVYALWEQFMCIAMVVTLLVWFRTRFNKQGALAKMMSPAAYATFIVHQPVLVLILIALRGIKLDLGLKWLLVAPFAVAACFLVGWVVKKLPLVRRIV